MKIISENIIILLLVLSFSACNFSDEDENEIRKFSNLSEIKERGKLVAVTDNNSTSYFIYRGTPLGFQYELLKEYSDYMGLDLEIVISNNIEEKINLIKNGKVDVLAVNLSITKTRKVFIDFTIPLGSTRPVLVQRKPENYKNLSKSKMDEKLIRDIKKLNGKTVFVQEHSSFVPLLKRIEKEHKIVINSFDAVSLGIEELVLMVSEGKIDYTVCDEDVARINATYLQNIDIETGLGDEVNFAWAVAKGNDSLRISINNWLNDFKKTKRFESIYYRYFNNPKYKNMINSDYYSLIGGKISQYDEIIKELSKETYWDWRLISSLIYHESNFDNSVRSWAGAAGLMQLMPQTAATYGIDIESGPTANIAAGIKVINSLDNIFKEEITDTLERIKFILASYNIGPGHVIDARNLAKKYGKNPNIWENNVDTFLLLKSNPEYYRDSVVKNGYCRGNETVNFVKRVLEVFGHYKNLIDL
ncbi:MAG: transporter substrate-binding domain-containing protein [Bacteroidales bacterium]|nr:transporter substrate-binding domain-containing protein [Bacteroidales bacterium]